MEHAETNSKGCLLSCRANLGVVATVGGIYACFVVMLVMLRLQRTKQSMQYVTQVKRTR